MDAREPSGFDPSEHSGIMNTPNSFGSGAGVPSHSMIMAKSAGMMPAGMRFPTMPSSSPKPLDASGSNYPGDGVLGMGPGGMFSMSEPMKKKRGRPRKYGPDGTMALALCSTTSTSEYDNANTSLSEPMVKRRGRPPGSGKRKLGVLGSSGTSFTPHVIAVKAGEDVASKIMAFSQQGPRTICILSANGAICNVTLQQPTTSYGTITYEGRFEIISLSGSFLLTENDGTRSRTGSLSVELAGSDGHVLGGVVAGILMAATTVQVVVGSFIAKKKPKLKPPSTHEPSLALPQPMPGFGPLFALSSPSQLSSSDSDDDRGGPVNHNSGHCSNSNHQFQGLPPYSVGWSNAGN